MVVPYELHESRFPRTRFNLRPKESVAGAEPLNKPPRGDFVALALSSPDGNALFEVPRSVLVRFLRRTYVVVPRGRESEHLDVDAAVNRLLAGR